MSKKYRAGQFIGIIIGVIAGHMIINSILPRQSPPPQQMQPQINYQNQQQFQPKNNNGVFEQALSK